MSSSRIQQFEDWLVKRGRRLTNVKRQIAALAFAAPCPVDPKIIVDAVVKAVRPQQVSRSTTYRTLFELQQAGLIRVNHDFTGSNS